MSPYEPALRVSAGILLVAALAAVFTAGSFLVPPGLRILYAPVCHQLPERSFELGSVTLAVCARCTGLYLGGIAGLVVGAIVCATGRLRPRAVWLAVAAAPTAIDALLPWVGLEGLANVPRFALALPLGFTAALFLTVGLEDLFRRPRSVWR